MKRRIIGTIFRKEILDTLRDKRALLMMVGVPVVLYPAMVLITMQLVLLQHQNLDAQVSRVAIDAPDPGIIRSWLTGLAKITIEDSAHPEEDLSAGRVEAVIQTSTGVERDLDAGCTVELRLLYDATEFASVEAASRLENALDKVFAQIQEKRLEEAGVAEHYIRPLDVVRENTAPPAKTTGNILGLVLPFVMIMMVALGAFYPAIDLTAGEKERGTFETLLATPTTKLEIVTGKFLAVFVLAMVTAFLNLASMAATFTFLLAQLRGAMPYGEAISLDLPFQSFLVIFLVVVPLAFFISAVMMSVAVFARSFKEAQTYLTPFFMVIMVPAMAAGLPGMKLSATSQFIPVANVVLLFRELMTGKAGFEAVFYVFLSTTIYALLALLLAAWLFQREELVLSEERGIPLSFRRSEFTPRGAPTAGLALGMFAVVMLLMFYAGSVAQQWRLVPGLLITEYGLILFPTVLVLWFVRVRLRDGLNLKAPRISELAAGVLIAPACVVLLIQFGLVHDKVLPIPEDFVKVFENLFSGADTGPGLLLLVFAVGVSPAICEEVLFRGALLSGLRTRLGPWSSVLVVGALFGVFHISIYRIVPTALVGIVLTYVVVRSGSIYVAMLLHFLFNTLGVLLATETYPAFLHDLLALDQIETQGVPVWMLGGAVFTFAAGLALIESAARGRFREGRA